MIKNKLSLKSLILKSGSHKSPEEGLCVMEAVAYFAGEPHSDKPECACPVLTSFMISLNDSMREDDRKILKPYIKKLIGTRDGNSQKRADIFVRTSVAVFAADALKLTGIPALIEHSNKLKEVGKDGTLEEMRSAARSAASSAASSSAYSAARSAAYSAAEAASSAADAARSAAYAAYSAAYAARSTAYSAARMKIWKKALKALDQALAIRGGNTGGL